MGGTPPLVSAGELSSSPSLTMSLPSFGSDNCTTILSTAALLVVGTHVVPYAVDTHKMRSIPGPWLAKFTDAWLGRVAARGHRSEVVHQLHKQYGKSLSLQNHEFSKLTTLILQEPLFASLRTTSQLPTQTLSKLSTPTETEA